MSSEQKKVPSILNWYPLVVFSIILFSIALYIGDEYKIRESYMSLPATLKTIFLTLFGLLTLKFMNGLGQNDISEKYLFAYLFNVYICALVFLSLMGSLSWAIPVGGAVALLGFPLYNKLSKN